MSLSKRQLLIAGVGVVGLAVVAAPGCSRVERQNVEGVDCVVVKSPIGQPRHVDCDWPDEGRENPEEPQAPQ